jgi:hypothetical protein
MIIIEQGSKVCEEGPLPNPRVRLTRRPIFYPMYAKLRSAAILPEAVPSFKLLSAIPSQRLQGSRVPNPTRLLLLTFELESPKF